MTRDLQQIRLIAVAALQFVQSSGLRFSTASPPSSLFVDFSIRSAAVPVPFGPVLAPTRRTQTHIKELGVTEHWSVAVYYKKNGVQLTPDPPGARHHAQGSRCNRINTGYRQCTNLSRLLRGQLSRCIVASLRQRSFANSVCNSHVHGGSRCFPRSRDQVHTRGIGVGPSPALATAGAFCFSEWALFFVKLMLQQKSGNCLHFVLVLLSITLINRDFQFTEHSLLRLQSQPRTKFIILHSAKNSSKIVINTKFKFKSQ